MLLHYTAILWSELILNCKLINRHVWYNLRWLRVVSETQTAEKPKTQRSWSAGPGISTAIIRHGSMSVGRDSASPSPPPMLSRFTGVNSFESLATHNSQLGGTTSSAGTPSGARVPHREHLTIAPSYNRNILKEDVNKLMEREQEQRLNLSVCENGKRYFLHSI